MATVLEVTDPAAKTRLGQDVEAAMREYGADNKHARPSPKKLHKTFDDLFRRYRDLCDSLAKLGQRERSILDDASRQLHASRRGRDEPFGVNDALAALKKIGILIREGQHQLPVVKHGPEPDSARWYLVHRLGAIYAKNRSHLRDDGTEEFEMPRRRRDPYEEKDYGPFRDFVVAVHEALGFKDPAKGVDDVIRSVWGDRGKKRAT